jgi:hypothetical protein
MDNVAEKSVAAQIITDLGGTTAVHRLTAVPISTVHSWRKNGIPPSRLAHLCLAAEASKKPISPSLVKAAEAEWSNRTQQAAAA